MGNVFNLDSTDQAAGGPIKLFANLILFQAMIKGADEIILTLKSSAEWPIAAAKDPSLPDTAKIREGERVPLMEAQPVIPDQKTNGAAMEDVIEAAKNAEALEARASGLPIVENPQVMELLYVIPGKGRVHSTPPPPVFCYPHLIRLLLLHANIPFARALFLRIGIPYWNHGPVEGTFQTTCTIPSHNTLWKLESADTTRELRLIRLRG